MDLTHLKVFIAVAESGSISKASNLLYMAPSTVSSRITSLEEEVGAKLFSRNPAGAALTEAGRRLYYYAFCALSSIEAAIESIEQMKHEQKEPPQPFHIGISGLLVPLVLPVVSEVLQGTRWRLTTGSSMQICLLAQTADIHMALIHVAPTYDEDMESTLLAHQDIKLIAPYSDTQPFKNLRTMFQNKTFILLKKEKMLRELLQKKLFEPLRMFPDRVIEVDSALAIKELVAKGAGYSFLPESNVLREINRSLRIIETTEVRIKQPWYCVYPKSLVYIYGEQIQSIVESIQGYNVPDGSEPILTADL